MAGSSVAGLLTEVDSLFTTQAERETNQEVIVHLSLDEISDFPNHPYKVRMDESMVELVDSVKLHGVIIPALVRPMPDGSYQMIAGHRRKFATELAGVQTLPCIVRKMTDDEAIIVMVGSNVQRVKLLPSERAFAYKMRLDAMKRQGYRADLTSANDLQKLIQGQTSRSSVAKEMGKSHETIRLYICLTNLIPELLDMADNAVLKEPDKLQIALRPAVELSYLTEIEQRHLLESMQVEDRTPSHAQAIKMREYSEKGKLTVEVIESIMQEEKPNQVEQFKMPKSRIEKFFAPGTPVQQMEDTIVKALEMYRKRQRDRAR
ncbi:MAG: ParB/RepB/Spo0J family partition protein [Oscillospiraceae bacterium]|nr:ParB/RepB/Spo0J family partition protein [Oscillospiraceae bacterium]